MYFQELCRVEVLGHGANLVFRTAFGLGPRGLGPLSRGRHVEDVQGYLQANMPVPHL